MLKLFISLVIVINLTAQNTDSLKTEIAENPFDSVPRFDSKSYDFEKELYSFNLFSNHRPVFKAKKGYFPNSFSVKIDRFAIRSLFSDVVDFRLIQDERFENYQLRHNKLTAQPYDIDFLIPYTKLNIIDGDFNYTDVNVAYLQRLSGRTSVRVNINNTTSEAGIDDGLYKSPEIFAGLEYLVRKNTRLKFSYLFKRRTEVDLGYSTNAFVDLNQDFDFKDNYKMLTLLYVDSANIEVGYNYMGQSRNGHLEQGLRYFDMNNEMSKVSLKKYFGLVNLTLSASNEAIVGTVFRKPISRNKFAIDLNYQNDFIEANIHYGHVFGTAFTDLNQISNPYQIHLIYTSDYFNLSTDVFNRLPSVNELHFSKAADEADNDNYATYLGAVNANPNLANEQGYYANLNIPITRSLSTNLSGLYFQDKISYNQVNGFHENRYNCYVGTANLTYESEVFNKFILNGLVDINYERLNTYLPDIFATLSIDYKFIIFSNLNINIDLFANYYGERNAVNYLKYTDSFYLNQNIIYDPIIVPGVKVKFRIKTVDVIFEMNNFLNRTYSISHGYESLSSQVKFGVKWGFLN